MKNYKKTIKLFLMDGNPDERIICELTNWDGIAYKIPRAMLKESQKLQYINNTGVYLLLGEKEDYPCVYVGEAENLFIRMSQHLIDEKEFWTECILFTRKDNSLNKAHVKYIENILYSEAKKSAKYEVDNSTIPTQSSLSEFEEAEMEEIVDNIKMLTNAMGYKVFSTNKEKTIQENKRLYLKIGKVQGTGAVTNDGFVVYAGSNISNTIAEKSYNKGYRKIRERLLEEGIINKDTRKFVEDYTFKSPSAAAAVLMGYNQNGLLDWKNKDGKTLKELGY